MELFCYMLRGPQNCFKSQNKNLKQKFGGKKMWEKKYYLYVKRRKVEVSEELYKSYYVEVEKLKN